MKCREFERDLPEWVAGRLSATTADAMAAHSDICTRCAALEAEERDLRARWRDLPVPERTPDLWLRVAARIEQPAPRPRFRFGWQPAFAGALAACGLLAVVLVQQLPKPATTTHTVIPVAVTPVDEKQVVSQIAAIKSMPDPAEDPFYAEMQDHRDTTRSILTGEDGQ